MQHDRHQRVPGIVTRREPEGLGPAEVPRRGPSWVVQRLRVGSGALAVLGLTLVVLASVERRAVAVGSGVLLP